MTLSSRGRLIWRGVGGGSATEVAWAVICTVSGRTSNLSLEFPLQPRSIPLAANEPSKRVVFTFKVAVAGPSSACG